MTPELVHRFLHPWFLLALPLPFVWLLIQRVRDRANSPAVLYSDLSVARGIPRSIRQRILGLMPWTRTAALCLGVLALARPQFGTIEYSANSLGVDIAMVIDISGSMQEQDFRPNRLEAAKQAAVNFINERRTDRVSIVVFAESAALLCPPTLDMSAARVFVESINDRMLRNQSTAVGDGLALAVSKLKDSPAKSRVAILLTDGESNAGKLSPMQAAEIAKTLNVRVYTIGVGRDQFGGGFNIIGGQIRVPRGGGFDEESLKKIADMTGGRYFRATDEKNLNMIYDEIDKLEKTEIEVDTSADFNEKFFLFWFPGLFLLGVEVFLRAFWLRRLP